MTWDNEKCLNWMPKHPKESSEVKYIDCTILTLYQQLSWSFYLPNCIGFFVAWRAQLSKNCQANKRPKHSRTCKRDCLFLCVVCVCLRTCAFVYGCSFSFFFIRCVFAEGNCCAESAHVKVPHLQSAEIQVWFIVAEDQNFTKGFVNLGWLVLDIVI